MSRPDLNELRTVCQPPATLQRRNAEHWAARWFLRRVSLRMTALLVRTPVTANQLTGLMILIGLAAAVAVTVPSLGWAVIAVGLVLLYFLLDLCDGEVARWRRQTSVTGVYLDRVGHYMVEAAFLAGLGVRAGDQQWGGWTTLGVAAGLLVVLVKAETDLVDVARVRSGLEAESDGVAEPRARWLGGVRRVAARARIHTLTGTLEAACLLILAALVDASRGDLLATRVLLMSLFAIAALMTVLHLVSILSSSRLR